MNIPIVKEGDNTFAITVEKSIYSNEAIAAACYKYTDRLFVFLQTEKNDGNSVEIIAESKNGGKIPAMLMKEFCNELIDQQVRYNVNCQFGHIRDLIVEEAFKPINK